MNNNDNKNIYKLSFIEGLKPVKDYTVTEWADNFRLLSSKDSAEPGPYKSSRAPYGREIMDCLTANNGITEVVFMAGTQVSKTTIGFNWLGYVIDINPSSMILVFPTVDIAKKRSKQSITPMIEESPTLKYKIKPAKSRDGTNTVLVKEFTGGIINIIGANSAAGLRSIPAKYVYLDEVDAYPLDVEGEGDPIDLARKRTDTYGKKKKIFITSTPTIKGLSAVEKAYEDGDQRKYYVPCPFCKVKQPLIFDNLKFRKQVNNQKRVLSGSVYYECQNCKEHIKEHHKTYMLENGEWIAENLNFNNPSKRTYHLNSLYSPLGWFEWEEICNKFLESKDDNFKLKTFINTVLAQTWEADGSQPSYVSLLERAEDYKFFEINEKAIFLTAGVDIQDNRLAVIIQAWGENEECWNVYYTEIMGNPAEDDVFIELNKLIRRPFKHPSGVDLYIRKAAFDSGGHFAQRVYDFCNKNTDKYIIIKGSSYVMNSIISGKPNKNGVYFVGTSITKEEIYSRLRLEDFGDRYIHFSKDFDEEFYKMLTAEKMITKIVKGQAQIEWIKTYVRNEVLDCSVYSYAVAYHLGIKRMDYKTLYEQIIGKKLEELKPKVIEEEKSTNLNNNYSKLIRKNTKKGFVKKYK